MGNRGGSLNSCVSEVSAVHSMNGSAGGGGGGVLEINATLL